MFPERRASQLSPPTAALDDLLDRREQAQGLVASAMQQLAQAVSLLPGESFFPFTCMLGKQPWSQLGVAPEQFQQRVSVNATQAFDAAGWSWLIDASGMSALMTADDKQGLRKELQDEAPALTRINVHATFIRLFEERHEVFRRGVIELFRSLARQYRSHSAFQVNKRLILPGAFREGSWSSFSCARERVDDLERILCVLDGVDPTQIPHEERLSTRLEVLRRQGEPEHEDARLTCRWFANGNLHLWLRQPRHIDQINTLIAEHYGAALAHETAGRRSA